MQTNIFLIVFQMDISQHWHDTILHILFHPVSVSNTKYIFELTSQKWDKTNTHGQSNYFIDTQGGRVVVSGQTTLPFGISARNETKRNRTAPTSIIFRSFVVERIGCGANRSIGGQSWVAQRVNFGPCCAVRREISVVPRQGIHLSSGRYNWSCWLNGSIWCKSLVCDILGWITVPSDFSIRRIMPA